MDPADHPPIWRIWWVAGRPHTLTASLSPVIVGYNAGFSMIQSGDKREYWSLAVQWGLFCMLMQLGTNLHNDYADFVRGADTDQRLGQARAVQRGWLTPFQAAFAATSVLGIGLLLGMNFVYRAAGSAGWILLFLVISSVFNAFAYTGGPWPLGYMGLGSVSIGYSGLGDVFVFLYFGLVATLTLPYLYAVCLLDKSDRVIEPATSILSILPHAIQVATLATNIIVVNNLRDRVTDVAAEKNTLAVRFGAAFCRREYAINLAVAYGFVAMDALLSWSAVRLLPVLSLPIALRELKAVYEKDGRDLNPHVGGAAKVQLIFCVLLGIVLRIPGPMNI